MFARRLTALLAMTVVGAAGFAFAQTAKPAFTAEDRALIENYYKQIIGTLAPGSLDRTGFSPEIEKALTPGSRIPATVEKQLERLPAKLQAQLSSLAGDYDRYKLGRHVVMIRRTDFVIVDILRNVALNTPPK
jgi:hypothetical protein